MACCTVNKQFLKVLAAGSGCVDSDNPHPSSFLGSMVYDVVIDTLKERIVGWEEWEKVSRAAEKGISASEAYGVAEE